MKLSIRRWGGLGVLILAGILYGSALDRYAVGVRIDDAGYMLAAKYLAYSSSFPASLFNTDRLRHVMPGWPYLLAPMVRLTHPPYDTVKWLPMALTLLSCHFLWILLKPFVSSSARTFLVALFAFNPSVVAYTGQIMTEALFACLTLLSFNILRKSLAHDRSQYAWVLGIVFGCASLVRAEGLALMAAATVVMIYEKRWRLLAKSMGLGLGFYFIFYCAGILFGDSTSYYTNFWVSIVPLTQGHVSDAFWHALGVLETLFMENLLAWPYFGIEGFGRLAPLFISTLGTLLAIQGIARLDREKGASGSLIKTVAIFFWLYMVIHMAWPSTDSRFLIVLVPILHLFLYAGCQQVFAPSYYRAFSMVGLCLFLTLYGYQDLQAIRESRRPLAENRLPSETFRWIEQNIDRDAPIASFLAAPMIALHTEHQTLSISPVGDPDLLRHRMIESGAKYFFFEPLRVRFEPVPATTTLKEAWVSFPHTARLWPEAFVKVYENPAEETSLYRLGANDRFEKAYAFYLAALVDFQHANWDRGLTKLEMALILEPHFPSALNAYGATCLLTGRSLGRARQRLQEALRLRPDFEVARANLARITNRP